MPTEREPTVRVERSLSAADRRRVIQFLHAAGIASGDSLNDHLLSDLVHGPRAGFTAALASIDDELTGYAQVSTSNDGVIVGSVTDDDHCAELLLHAVLATVPPSTPITWWATDRAAALAARLGMAPHRRLLKMHTPLPVAQATDVATRPFEVGVDEQAWLAVNNAAFAWHGEQGGWDAATLHQRELEPWFSAEGFLLHERDDRLAAFCWTKLHPGIPQVGEIYVIAVHPDFHGLGLGRALTLAGLQHLHASGATEAMLYVDADNTAAVTLYEHLGFTVAHAEQSFQRNATPSAPLQGSPS
jgi:mycothiol synthase